MDKDNGTTTMDHNGIKTLPNVDYDNYLDYVNSWFLMGSPLSVTIILTSYLLFVLKIGPDFMKKRKPYKLQNIIPLYNAVQVLVSCFLLYLCVAMMSVHGLVPKTCVMETENVKRSIAAAMYYYLLAKLSELLDTIFFVFRKKDNQVSFLHVYHHTLMVIVTWTALKYEPTYSLMFLGLLNSFVHVVMYTYYGLSSFPNLAKYLWWKKYITSMQLIQFVLVLIHFAIASVRSECTPSYVMSVAMATNGTLFLYLFGSFYIKTYKKSSANVDNSNEILKDNGTKNGFYIVDKNLYANGVTVGNSCSKFDEETNYTSASLTLNDTYRIRFNVESKKLT